MNRTVSRVLFWSPRILSMLLVGFLSLFSMDVFSETSGFWKTLAAFAIHEIPAGIVLVGLLLAWRWEWIGTVVYLAAAAAYGLFSLPRHPDWFMGIGGPLVLIALLFLLNWVKRSEMLSEA